MRTRRAAGTHSSSCSQWWPAPRSARGAPAASKRAIATPRRTSKPNSVRNPPAVATHATRPPKSRVARSAAANGRPSSEKASPSSVGITGTTEGTPALSSNASSKRGASPAVQRTSTCIRTLFPALARPRWIDTSCATATATCAASPSKSASDGSAATSSRTPAGRIAVGRALNASSSAAATDSRALVHSHGGSSRRQAACSRTTCASSIRVVSRISRAAFDVAGSPARRSSNCTRPSRANSTLLRSWTRIPPSCRTRAASSRSRRACASRSSASSADSASVVVCVMASDMPPSEPKRGEPKTKNGGASSAVRDPECLV